MREQIIEHISHLEQNEQITVLLAVESGSRAWGCPSPDSDYDVRIIYKRPKSAYLELDDKPDTINYFHGKLLDINGWDIRKVLRLIRKSNATPFEWSQSPIRYKEQVGFSARILELCKEYFQAYHAVNHYRGIAKNTYLGRKPSDHINLKKLFYVLRPLMAAKWIVSMGEVPPMDIPSLLDIVENKSMIRHINHLLDLKKTVNEDYMHKLGSPMADFINEQFDQIESVRIQRSRETPSYQTLNQAFASIIEE